MTTLCESILVDNVEVKIWHSPHIHLRLVLSSVMKKIADMLDKKQLFSNLDWGKFGESQVVWATTPNDLIIGGICFSIDKPHNMAQIDFVFTENESLYNAEINNLCMAHVKLISKKLGLTGIMQHIHVDNKQDIQLAQDAGMTASFYLLTRPLIDDHLL